MLQTKMRLPHLYRRAGPAQDPRPLRRPQGLRSLSPAGQPTAGGRHYPTPAGAQQGFYPQSCAGSNGGLGRYVRPGQAARCGAEILGVNRMGR
jgi:hypothetical protein